MKGVARYEGLTDEQAAQRHGSEISIRNRYSHRMNGPDSPVTPSQIRVLRFIAAYFEAHGWWPDLREMAAAVALPGCKGSPNNIRGHLQRLQTKGLIYVQPGTARAMRITEKGWAALKTP